VANFFLHLLDGKRERTYGNTCSDTFIGHGSNKISIDDLLRQDFLAARGAFTNKMISVTRSLNLMNVGHCSADGRSFEELRDEIRAAREAGSWLVYVIHGVGAETKELYIERNIHERLLDHLAEEKKVWTQPFITVASWIRQWQEG
jgi:hypothetical protein